MASKVTAKQHKQAVKRSRNAPARKPAKPKARLLNMAVAFRRAKAHGKAVVASAFGAVNRVVAEITKSKAGLDYLAMWTVIAKEESPQFRSLVKGLLLGPKPITKRRQYLSYLLGQETYAKADGTTARRWRPASSGKIKSVEERIRRSAIDWGATQTPPYKIPSARVGQFLSTRGKLKPVLLIKALLVKDAQGKYHLPDKENKGRITTVNFTFDKPEFVSMTFGAMSGEKVQNAVNVLSSLLARKVKAERAGQRLPASKEVAA